MTQIERTKGLWGAFAATAQERGSSIAYSTSDGELRFAELLDAADKLATELAAARIDPGSMVVLSLPNSLAFVPTLLGLWKHGCVVALASPKYHSAEVAAITQRLQPQVMITAENALPDGLSDFVTSSTLGFGSWKIGVHQLKANPKVDASVSEIALIKLTSGSTGEPKGIALTAANLIAESENVCGTLNITAKDRIVAPVPLCHSYGFDLGVLPMIARGAMLVARDSFVPRALLKDLSNSEASLFLGVPSMYRFLLAIETASIPELGHLRYLLSCTAPLNPQVISEFHERFRVAICQHYGSTESGAISNHVPADVLIKPQSVGRALRGVSVSICDDDGAELPAGWEGEVVVRSKAVAARYVMGAPYGHDPLSDGVFRTGDSGYLDADGFLHVSGRIDSVINVGGLKVYPLEVVHVLEGLPQIREAVVHGVKDGSGEEVPYAVVTLKTPVTESEILKHCHRQLAEHKVPRRIKIVDKIPTGPTGKPLFPLEAFGT